MKRLTGQVLRFIVGALLLAEDVAHAAPPPLLPMQGFLTDESDVPLEGIYRLELKLFDASSGGTAFYAETQGVQVTGGHFTLYLGHEAPLDLSGFVTRPDVWLEVKIVQGCGADSSCNTGTLVNRVLTPRLQVATTAFAAMAAHCDSASTLVGTGATAFARSDQTCGTSQKVRGVDDTGTLMCGADEVGTPSCAAGQILLQDGTDWKCHSARVGGYTVASGSPLIAGDTNYVFSGNTFVADASVTCVVMVHLRAAKSVVSGTAWMTPAMKEDSASIAGGQASWLSTSAGYSNPQTQNMASFSLAAGKTYEFGFRVGGVSGDVVGAEPRANVTWVCQ